MTEATKKPLRGRKPKKPIKINASPERIARAIFAAAEKPDLSKRLPRVRKPRIVAG